MRCLLVDDEPLARDRLRALLEESGTEVEIVAEAGGGKEAVSLIHEHDPEVVFLDVQMPVLGGFDVVDLLPEARPHIVFVTAYDEYAIEAFEVHALDYLTKPVRLERLEKTLDRVREAAPVQGGMKAGETTAGPDASEQDAGEQGGEERADGGERADEESGLDALREARSEKSLKRITVHVGRRLRVVPLEDIRWIEADEGFVFAHTPEGRYRTDFTLGELEKRLPEDYFVRTHRSAIVHIDAVYELLPEQSGTGTLRLEDGTEVDVARRRRSEVEQALGA